MYLYIFSSTYKNTFPWRNNLCCESAPGWGLVWGGGGAHLRVVMVEVTSPPWVGRSASPPTFPSAWAWMWSFGMAQKLYYVLIQALPNASVRGFFHEFLLLSVTCSFMAHQGNCSVIFGSLMTLVCDAEFSLFFWLWTCRFIFNLHNVNNTNKEVVKMCYGLESVRAVWWICPGNVFCGPWALNSANPCFIKIKVKIIIGGSKTVVVMEGKSDYLVPAWGLLLASRLDFGQVNGLLNCNKFCAELYDAFRKFPFHRWV